MTQSKLGRHPPATAWFSRVTAILVARPPSLETLAKAAMGEHGVIASYGRLMGNAMLFFEDGAVLAMTLPDPGSTTTHTLSDAASGTRFCRVQAVVPLSP